jgi:rhodanese-related sulfurtransferase
MTQLSEGPEPEIDVTEIADWLDAGAALLDVRESDEWAAGHAAAAVHVPMGQLTLDLVPTGRPVLVVCHLGMRSAAVCAALRRAGVDARNVHGGMDAWEQAGLPIEE